MSPSSDAAVELSVLLPADLHARPAGRVVQVAAGFTATVDVRSGDKSAPARSVLALMALGATIGTTVVVRATGPDAAAAVAEVAGVLSTAD